MTKEEKILLGLTIAALVAVVIYQRKPDMIVPVNDPVVELGKSITPRNDSVVTGPEYLTYNSPWFFAPPIGNFLPSTTAGQGNQTVNQPTNFDCGCS